MFTEIYEKKVHKSYALGEKNDHIVSRIKDLFLDNKYDKTKDELKVLEIVK